MANEIIKVNLIPGVDDPTPILHFSQYDNGRTFIAEMYSGEDPFDCDAYNVTLECRKRDNNLVILTADTIDNNQITFHSTEQLCACFGDNDSEIVIRDNNDLVIGSGNIIINVEKSPTCGGIQSETVIDNLTRQIEQITQRVIGDDYYNKNQTDALLENKADIEDVYNKEQIDNRLLLKADKATTYTKEQVDELIDNLFPTFTASGAIASFITALNKPLVSVTADLNATNITRCGVNQCKELFTDGYVPSVANGNLVQAGGSRSDFIMVKPSMLYSFLIDDTAQMLYMFFYDENKTYISYSEAPNDTHTSFTATTPANCKYMMLRTRSSYVTKGMLAEGSHTQYETYNGITVSKDIATTIETLSGVNNVFADSGDITVQYKYMSM